MGSKYISVEIILYWICLVFVFSASTSIQFIVFFFCRLSQIKKSAREHFVCIGNLIIIKPDRIFFKIENIRIKQNWAVSTRAEAATTNERNEIRNKLPVTLYIWNHGWNFKFNSIVLGWKSINEFIGFIWFSICFNRKIYLYKNCARKWVKISLYIVFVVSYLPLSISKFWIFEFDISMNGW